MIKMEKLKSPVIAPESIAVVFVPTGSKTPADNTKGDSTSSPGRKIRTGKDLFKELVRENKHSVWNKTLSESIRGITFVGYLEPWTILVKGNEKHLETIRDAYARRILKPPRNFAIVQFGDVPSIELIPVQQAQFIPLTEVLCLIVSEMNRRKIGATQDSIRLKLSECYSKMPVPSPDIIHKSLSYLIHEGKVEYSSDGYRILSFDDTESILTATDIDEASIITTQMRLKKNPEQEQKKEERIYLVYKDGVLTKHTLPETILDESGSASRPISYPSNSADPRVGFQRSQSMRVGRNMNGSRYHFERTNSVRMDAYDAGYITSDNEAKQSCLGRLLSKSYQKKPLKASTSPQAEIRTFSGQFPPSDVNDPFFSYSHWAGRDKKHEDDNRLEEKKGKNKDSSSLGRQQKKGLQKDSNKLSSGPHLLDHGRLTMTAQSLQHKYQNMNEESMPESETEFLRPTQMYDNRYRTKAVSQQSQSCKTAVVAAAKKPPKEYKGNKDDKIKHFFNSMEVARPVNPKPFQGLTSDEERDLDHFPSKEPSGNATKAMKERRQARVFADAKLSDLDADDLDAINMPKDVKVLMKSDAEEPPAAVVRRPGRAMPVSQMASNISTSKTLPSRPPPTNGGSAERPKEPKSSSSLNYRENNELRLRTEAALNRARPKSFSADSTLRVAPQVRPGRKSLHGGVDCYGDEEIDELMKDELKKEKVRKASYPSAVSANGLPPPSLDVNDYRQNEINSQLEHSGGSRNDSFERMGSVSSNSTHDYISLGSEVGSQVSSGMSGMPNSLSSRQGSVGRREGSVIAGVESLYSTADSGFNSPRSSLMHGAPTPNQELVDPVQPVAKGSTSAIVRPIPRKNAFELPVTAQQQAFGLHCNPQSSPSDQSSGSEVTVRARLLAPSVDDGKSDSSGRTSSHTGSSNGRGAGSRGHGRDSLGGANSFGVIATV